MKLVKRELSYKYLTESRGDFVSIKKPEKNLYNDYKGLIAIGIITYILFKTVMMF